SSHGVVCIGRYVATRRALYSHGTRVRNSRGISSGSNRSGSPTRLFSVRTLSTNNAVGTRERSIERVHVHRQLHLSCTATPNRRLRPVRRSSFSNQRCSSSRTSFPTV